MRQTLAWVALAGLLAATACSDDNEKSTETSGGSGGSSAGSGGSSSGSGGGGQGGTAGSSAGTAGTGGSTGGSGAMGGAGGSTGGAGGATGGTGGSTGGTGGAAPSCVPCSPDNANFVESGVAIAQAAINFDFMSQSCSTVSGVGMDQLVLDYDTGSGMLFGSGAGFSVLSISEGTFSNETDFFLLDGLPADTPIAISLERDSDQAQVDAEFTITMGGGTGGAGGTGGGSGNPTLTGTCADFSPE